MVMSYEELKEKYENLQLKYNEQKIEIENQKIELDNLRRVVFGTRREYTPNCEKIEDGSQCSIFCEEVEDVDEDLKKQITEQVETITVYRRKKAKKRKVENRKICS